MVTKYNHIIIISTVHLFELQKTRIEEGWGDFEGTLEVKDSVVPNPSSAASPMHDVHDAQSAQQKTDYPSAQPSAIVVPQPGTHQDEPNDIQTEEGSIIAC